MKPTTCVIIDDALSTYHFGESHPFGPRRYQAFKQTFEQRDLSSQVQCCTPTPTGESTLELFHTSEYIKLLKQKSRHPQGYLDSGDTPARKGIFEAACLVVGGVLKAIDQIMSGQCPHAFSPIAGLHHATRDSAAGFCAVNDCGIAIEYLRQHYGLKRIAYIDIDAHHGDGVFYAYESDPDICIVDFHQDGNTLYPGTGFIHETGTADATGSKLNVPLPPFTRDELALKLWAGAETFIEKAQPEFMILQCGADSLSGDPITQLELSEGFHRYVAERLSHIAAKTCQGRLLALGGGGYNLDNISLAWNAVIESLIKPTTPD